MLGHLNRMTPWAELKCKAWREQAFARSLLCARLSAVHELSPSAKPAREAGHVLHPFYRHGN